MSDFEEPPVETGGSLPVEHGKEQLSLIAGAVEIEPIPVSVESER